MGKTHTPVHVANFFIDKANHEDFYLTPLKMLKLVYISYGWVIALTGKQLFEEDIQAWKSGPIVPSLYHEFKRFGCEDIKENACNFDLDTCEYSEQRVPESEKDIIMILNKVWYIYKQYKEEHMLKPLNMYCPWGFNEANPFQVIPMTATQTYYKKKIKQYLDLRQEKKTEEKKELSC